MKTIRVWLWFTALFTSAAYAQTAPTIASISSSQRVTEGQALSLSVSVNGTAPFTYQWKKEGTAISGATTSTYAVAQIATTDSGSYTVTIANAGGTLVSNAILVDVTPATAPSFYYQPGPYTITVGDTLSLGVSVSGTSPFTYVWKRGTTTLATTTSSSYSKAGATSADAGSYTVTVTNVAGTITSSPFTVTVNPVTAPVFSSSPSSTTIDAGSSASLYSYVSNSTGVTFQWYKGDVAISGATSYYYYATEAGTYTVKATNAAGTTTSSAAVVTVRAAVAPTLSISTGPVVITAGESLSLYSSASGTGPITYQWKRDGVNIAGATSASYFKSNLSAADAGTYSLVATNSVGSATSEGTVVSVTSAQLPIITYHPSSRTVYPGDYVSLGVNVTGTGVLSYGWKKDGSALPNSNSSSYTVSSSVAGSDAGVYTVTVSNSQGSVTSQPATITVLGALAPTIQAQPAAVAVLPGENINFSVSAGGRPDPTYQWKKDGIAISGATSSYYGKSAAAASDAGSYSVTVTNSAGSVTSASATAAVGVITVPVIVLHPSSGSALLNDFIQLSIEVDNWIGATVQWYRDGTAIPNATSYSYYISNAQPAHAGTYRATVTNAAGSTTSKDAVWTVDLSSARPVITATSGSQAVNGGNYAQISVNVSSNVKTYTVAWKKDGVVVPNATSLYLTLSPFALSMEGTYTAEVTTGGSTYTGRPIEVALRDKGSSPLIARHPQSTNRVAGDYLTFEVFARGELPLTYQWYKDGVAIPSATSAYYGLSSIAASHAGNYTVTVTNRNGSVTSAVAALTVAASASGGKPVFGSEPASQTLTEGSGSYLSLGVSLLNGTSGDSYQWYKDGTAIPGATSSSYYYFNGITTALSGRYQVKVTNTAGSATSGEAIITITKRATGPAFTTQPAAQSGYTGGSVTFTAAATGNGTVSYQWRKDGTNLAGATGASLTLTHLQPADAAAYTVVATDADGSTPSAVAALTVLAATPPSITSQPAPQISGLTGSVSFSVTATGSPAPTYQWRKNGNDIGGATSATLSLTNLVAGDAATYSVVVTNPAGTVTSSGASLIVYDQIPSAPAFTTQPQNRSATPGETVLLSVAVSGFPAPSLQWYKNGSAIAGATEVTLSLGAMKPALAGQYHAVATNPIGTAQSVAATLAYVASPYAGTYFGTLGSGEAWALKVEEDGTATFLGMISGSGKMIYATDVIVSPTGAFSFGQNTAASSIRAFAISSTDREIQAASYYFSGTVSGQITGGAVSGQVAGATGAFTGSQVTGTSPAAGMAGAYNAIPLGSGLGEVRAIAARDGTLLLVAADGAGVRGGKGTISSSGAFSVVEPQFTYSGNLAASQGTMSGTYQPIGGTPVVISPPAPTGSAARERLVNVSTRGMAGIDSKTLIVGFVVSGSGPQDLLLRAVGPTLGNLGVKGFLVNPRLKLYKGSTVVLENDDWMLGGAGAEITATGDRLGAYPLANQSADAALLAHLQPGVYSAHVSASDNSTGITLMEVYDASPSGSTGPKVVNLSARGSVAPGDDILIIGFVIEGTAPKKVLVRGLGPALAGAGVEGALSDPKLQLYRSGVKVNENDNWSSGTDALEIAAAASAVGAFDVNAGTKDSALLVYLAPGVYSAHVSGVNNTSGVALVEVYEVP